MQTAITPIDLLTGTDREADRQTKLRAMLEPGMFIWVKPAAGGQERPGTFRGWCKRTGNARVLLTPQRGGAPRSMRVDLAFVSL